MKAIKLNEIKPNFVPNLEVYFDDAFLLLFPFTFFTDTLKKIFVEADILTVYSEGEFVDIDEIIENDEFAHENSFFLVSSSALAQVVFQKGLNKLKEIFALVPSQQKFVYEDLNSFIYSDVLPNVHNAPNIYLAISEFTIEPNSSLHDQYVANMLVNLYFILASLEIDYSKSFPSINKKVQLAISAMLLDVGVLPIIQQLEKDGKIATINIRSKKIVPIIAKMGNNIYKHSFVPNTIIAIIEATHTLMINPLEVLDLSIQDAAKYIFTSISYAHLISRTINHQAKEPYTALTMILQKAKLFSPKFVKALTYTLGHAPEGTYVLLNNDCYGMVISSQLSNLKCPLVHIVVGTNGELKTHPTVVSTVLPKFGLKSMLSVEESQVFAEKRKLILGNIPTSTK